MLPQHDPLFMHALADHEERLKGKKRLCCQTEIEQLSQFN